MRHCHYILIMPDMNENDPGDKLQYIRYIDNIKVINRNIYHYVMNMLTVRVLLIFLGSVV